MFPEAKYEKIKNWIDGETAKPELGDTFQDRLILSLVDQCKTYNLPQEIPAIKKSLSFEQIEQLLAEVLSGSAEDDDAETLLSSMSSSRETFDKISLKLNYLEKELEPEAEKLLPGLLQSDKKVLAFLNENFGRMPQKENSFSFADFFNSILNMFTLKPVPAYVGTFAVVLLVVFALGLSGGIDDSVYTFYFNSEGAYYNDAAAFRGTAGVESTEDTASSAMFKAAMGEYLTDNYKKALSDLDALEKTMDGKNTELTAKINLYKGLSCLGIAMEKGRWGYKSDLNNALEHLHKAASIQSGEIDRITFFQGLTFYLLADFENAQTFLNQVSDDAEFGERANELIEKITTQ
jgi:hypothetical protein